MLIVNKEIANNFCYICRTYDSCSCHVAKNGHILGWPVNKWQNNGRVNFSTAEFPCGAKTSKIGG